MAAHNRFPHKLSIWLLFHFQWQLNINGLASYGILNVSSYKIPNHTIVQWRDMNMGGGRVYHFTIWEWECCNKRMKNGAMRCLSMHDKFIAVSFNQSHFRFLYLKHTTCYNLNTRKQHKGSARNREIERGEHKRDWVQSEPINVRIEFVVCSISSPA